MDEKNLESKVIEFLDTHDYYKAHPSQESNIEFYNLTKTKLENHIKQVPLYISLIGLGGLAIIGATVGLAYLGGSLAKIQKPWSDLFFEEVLGRGLAISTVFNLFVTIPGIAISISDELKRVKESKEKLVILDKIHLDSNKYKKETAYLKKIQKPLEKIYSLLNNNKITTKEEFEKSTFSSWYSDGRIYHEKTMYICDKITFSSKKATDIFKKIENINGVIGSKDIFRPNSDSVVRRIYNKFNSNYEDESMGDMRLYCKDETLFFEIMCKSKGKYARKFRI